MLLLFRTPLLSGMALRLFCRVLPFRVPGEFSLIENKVTIHVGLFYCGTLLALRLVNSIPGFKQVLDPRVLQDGIQVPFGIGMVWI